MKAKIIKRALFGLPVGISVGTVITVIISACIGDGSFYPVSPMLIRAAGSETWAVAVQTLLCAVMGAGFAAASVIWETDSWSLAKQSGVYFFVACVLLLPIAYADGWMEHSVAGFLSYAGIFVGIFVAVWLSQYAAWKVKIKKMNDAVGKNREKK